jgi:hypothetical protein
MDSRLRGNDRSDLTIRYLIIFKENSCQKKTIDLYGKEEKVGGMLRFTTLGVISLIDPLSHPIPSLAKSSGQLPDKGRPKLPVYTSNGLPTVV